MSDALPPLRISATASSSLTSTLVQAKLGAFLASYGDRMKKGGDSTVTAQLHKLQEALEEEKLHRTAQGTSHARRIITLVTSVPNNRKIHEDIFCADDELKTKQTQEDVR